MQSTVLAKIANIGYRYSVKLSTIVVDLLMHRPFSPFYIGCNSLEALSTSSSESESDLHQLKYALH